MVTAVGLRGRLFPAVPVPFDSRGRIDRDAQARLASRLAEQSIGGVAIWAHTGRGLLLSREQRTAVLDDWKAALGGRGSLIAAAGPLPGTTDAATAFRAARAMAEHAAEGGADALLVHPPGFARGRPDENRLILDYHAEVAQAGLPLILFYLYEAAGGLSYDAETLAELLVRPEVVGIKVATLDSIMTFQDLARLVLERFREKVLLTGEDRFLGYSLMCGAQAALIGMGGTCTQLQASLLQAHEDRDSSRFLTLSAQADRLGEATFIQPMEGYIQRVLWCLVHEGVIPRSAAFDPWGPALRPDEFDHLGDVLQRLTLG
jgi:4-hydroxy-tetrahydrodipicolinate synthase